MGVGLDTLFAFIKDKGRHYNVNVMLMSGFGVTPCNGLSLDLNKYIDIKSETEKVIKKEYVQIFANPGKESSVFEKLQKVPEYTTYLKKDIPEHFHYKRGVYAPDILMVADPPSADSSKGSKGCHYSDPALVPNVRTTFMGWGDAFVGGGLETPPMRLVDIYQLFGSIMGLPLQPHNGSRAAVCGMLRE